MDRLKGKIAYYVAIDEYAEEGSDLPRERDRLLSIGGVPSDQESFSLVGDLSREKTGIENFSAPA